MPPIKPMPDIVYKYRSWQNEFHKSCLTANELYFASPKEINDPFDFRIFMDYSMLDTDEKKGKYIKRALTQESNQQEVDDLGGYDEAFRKNMEWFKEDPNKLQTYFNNKAEESLIRFRILCLSEIWDSILMWSHYADQHRGYCLGYDAKSFKNFGLFGGVHYQEDYPRMSPLEAGTFQFMLFHTLCKSKDWSYEREYRIVNILDKIERYSDKPTIYGEATIKEVILGLNIKYDDALAIGTLCKKNGIELYKAEKIPNKFGLTRVRVNLG